jgi:hypothetical protein
MATGKDYAYSGFDRGHLVPEEEISDSWNSLLYKTQDRYSRGELWKLKVSVMSSHTACCMS